MLERSEVQTETKSFNISNLGCKDEFFRIGVYPLCINIPWKILGEETRVLGVKCLVLGSEYLLCWGEKVHVRGTVLSSEGVCKGITMETGHLNSSRDELIPG